MNDTILVTGATGFVGKALCDELARRGLNYRPVSRTAGPGLFALGTIDGDTDWSGALAGVDAIVHLAARVHVMNDTAADPLEAFRAANTHATLNLARQAASIGVRRFVFISSVKVNGEETGPGRPFTAGDVPAPQDPYGQSKLEAEQALLTLAAESGMEVVIIRPPLVYGPGVRANFASLMRWTARGLPLPLGAVANSRSFVFVDNLVDFILLSLVHPQAAGRVFLVSDGRDLSIGELLRLMSAAMGRKSWLLPVPPALISGLAALAGRSAGVRRLLGSLQVDITETRRLTGWMPPHRVEYGLRLTVAAFLAGGKGDRR